MAAEFASLYRHLFRYTTGLGWMRRGANCWKRDDELTAFDCARQVARLTAAAETNAKLRKAICSARTIAAIQQIARTDPRLVLPPDAWDSDPFALNTPAGVVDLRSGRLKQREAYEFHTQCTSVAPDFEADCPTWSQFLLDVFNGDEGMVDFVHRVVGYSLTGDRREQNIFFLQGAGGNGKSTFIDTIAALAGTYGLKLPAHALMHSPVQGHPTELAMLRGKRLAISSEIEEGQHWAEGRIKELTGDETLTARYMRQDFFEFRQQQKHIVVGNFKPRLRGGDAALARRFLLVPFVAKFDGRKRDLRMPERLRTEGPTILAWAISGAAKWFTGGLAIPSTVADASREYLAEHDDLAQWVDERCVRTAEAKAKASPLYGDYVAWTKARGQNAPAMKTWAERMSVLPGVSKRKTDGVMQYLGIGLRASGVERGSG